VDWFEGIWGGFIHYSKSNAKNKKTGVSANILKEIGLSLTAIPEGFNAHKTVIKGYAKRAESIKDGNNIDWATAESLAFGSLVIEGVKVRMSGQDSKRGTFSHRHSVIADQTTGKTITPLNNLAENQGEFEVINSFLSEYAVMGFEYGYSTANPKNLVLWEGQFGDFANGAQIIIDQFLSAGEVKWMRSSGLVLLLPHGYEGQGPEHSSARLERYLQLCAEDNMQVVNITTPANYFHALRRQIHSNYRKPLIVMSPKSLLRHHLAVSSMEDFDSGTEFSPILVDSKIEYKSVNKVILCGGKIYYDLYEEAKKERKIALIRLEQFYPFPEEELLKELKKYSKDAQYVWCQEEPENMGGWQFIRPKIEKILESLNVQKKLQYIGRKGSASTAAGHLYAHEKEQKAIIKDAVN